MKKIWLAILLTGILILGGGCQELQKDNTEKAHNKAHKSFVGRTEFARLLNYKPLDDRDAEGVIVSGVVPHHLVAGQLTARFFETAAASDPRVVVIIGPNHENSGSRIITGRYDWQTPEGIVTVNQDVAERLMASGLAFQDEQALSSEHSIGNLAPFVKHFMPRASIVPIILHHDVKPEEVDLLLQVIESSGGDKVLVLASVDFSHYLTRTEAEIRDEKTLGLMRKWDLATIYTLGDEYLDSPASLATAFKWAGKQGIEEFSVLDHTNSGILMSNDIMETTSYFTLAFQKPFDKY